MKILRAVAAVILGYAVMVLLITLVQEVWFGGVSWAGSSYSVLFLAGFFTFLSAVAGGLVATFVSGGQSRIPVIVMSLMVVLETTVLVVTGRVGGPLWFDICGAASLVVGILGAFELVRTRVRARYYLENS